MTALHRNPKGGAVTAEPCKCNKKIFCRDCTGLAGYLPTTNEEHLFTGEAWDLCEGKRSKGFVRWVFFHSIHSIKKKPPTREADMMKKMNNLTVMKKQTHQEKQTSS